MVVEIFGRIYGCLYYWHTGRLPFMYACYPQSLRQLLLVSEHEKRPAFVRYTITFTPPSRLQDWRLFCHTCPLQLLQHPRRQPCGCVMTINRCIAVDKTTICYTLIRSSDLTNALVAIVAVVVFALNFRPSLASVL